MNRHLPRIACFYCSFGWGYLGDRERIAGMVPFSVPATCVGKIDLEQLLTVFRNGADGILILGCPDGECHFQEGNHQLRKRVELLRGVLAAHGIEPQRLALVFERDPAGERIERLVSDYANEVGELGPIKFQIEIKERVNVG